MVDKTDHPSVVFMSFTNRFDTQMSACFTVVLWLVTKFCLFIYLFIYCVLCICYFGIVDTCSSIFEGGGDLHEIRIRCSDC